MPRSHRAVRRGWALLPPPHPAPDAHAELAACGQRMSEPQGKADLGRCSNQRSAMIHFCSVGMLCSQVGGQLPEARALPPSHPNQDTCRRCPENGWAGWCTSPWSYRGRAALTLGPQGACGRGPGRRSPLLSPCPALLFLAAGSLSDRFSPLI